MYTLSDIKSNVIIKVIFQLNFFTFSIGEFLIEFLV